MSTSSRHLNATWLTVFLALATVWTPCAGTFKHITMDGSFEDWAGVPVAARDDEGDTEGRGGFDLREIYVANDEQYVYLRVVIWPSSTNANYDSFHHRFFIDSDNDPATGGQNGGLGSEMMIEDAGGYSQRYGTWNEGQVTGLDWSEAPTGVLTNYQYEARFSRAVRDVQPEDFPKGSGNPERDLPLFTQDAISIYFEAADSNWAYEDRGTSFLYELAPKPASFAGTKTLVDLTATNWRANDTGTDLGHEWLATDYDDSQAGWKQGMGLFGFDAPAGVYPAPVKTTLAAGQPAYYLRTHFTWSNDLSGAGFLVSNYLSAGAVFHLNGVEVHRIRMPAGPVTFTTPATGGSAQPGRAELFDLPTSALVVGDNVLEVELHPAAAQTSSLAFGLSVTASDNFPPRIVNPLEPTDRNVVEGQSTTLSPGELAGTQPFTFQWFKDGTAVAGATNVTLTLDEVTASDAGAYSVEIINPRGLKVSSRSAALTTRPVEVALTDSALPADQIVMEGATATFTIATTGSLPAYQWYKEGEAIVGATAAQLTLTNVPFSDNGKHYSVVVSNRVNNLSSRQAMLTVTRDQSPPTISAITGGGRSVIVTFSEAVDETSAKTATNYTLDGGASVQTAELDPRDAQRVTLQTTALKLGTAYMLSVAGVKDRFNNPAATSRPFRASITIDGNFDDWAGVTPAVSEPQDTATGLEFKEIYVSNDDEFLFIRFNFHAEVGQLPVDFYYHIFSDTDTNAATGMAIAGIGSEMMIENGSGYQQKNGGFNEGVVRSLDFALAPAAKASDFECRISRKTVYDSDGLPVYAGPAVALAFQLVNTSWSAVDTVPQGTSLVYTFVNYPPLAVTPGPINIRLVGANIELTWSGSGVLETRASLSVGDWAAVPNATSPFQVNPASGKAAFYRLRQ